MNVSVLYPPNYQSFSDEVIGGVVQRGKSSCRDRSDFSQPDAVTVTPGLPNGPLAPVAIDLSCSRQRQDFTTYKNDTNTSSSLSVAERLLLRRRQQSRDNMARYRMKMMSRVSSLEDSIQSLRKETYKLELQRQLLDFGVSTTRTSWNVMSEYFRLFRYALKDPAINQGPTSSMAALRFQHLQMHRAFLVATMAPDLITASGCGVETLLEDYRRVSLYHPDLDVQLVDLENCFGDTFVATTKVKATIFEKTLQLAFPHLVNDPDLWAALGSKLLGKQLIMRGSVRIIWDSENGRVVSLYNNVDLLAPLLEILGNLDDVERVFNRSLIRPDGSLVYEKSHNTARA